MTKTKEVGFIEMFALIFTIIAILLLFFGENLNQVSQLYFGMLIGFVVGMVGYLISKRYKK